MPAAGGPLRPVTSLASGERTHRWPQVLPGGNAVLFTVGTQASPDSYDAGNIDAVIVATGERRVVLEGAAMARYCGDGRLLYSRGAGLFSIAFDPERLTTSGEPIQVLTAVARDASTGAAHFACAADRTLAFVPGTSMSELRRLVWVDAAGTTETAGLPAGPPGSADFAGGQARRAPERDERERRCMGVRFCGRHVQPTDVHWHQRRADVVGGWIDRLLLVLRPFGYLSTLMKKPADGSRDAVDDRGSVSGRVYMTWIDPAGKTADPRCRGRASDRGDIVRVTLGTPARPRSWSPLPRTSMGEREPGREWLAYSQTKPADRKSTSATSVAAAHGGRSPPKEARSPLVERRPPTVLPQREPFHGSHARAGPRFVTVIREVCSTVSTAPASNPGAATMCIR